MKRQKRTNRGVSESQIQRFEGFLQDRADLIGCRAIRLLRQRPNQDFHSMALAQRTLYPDYQLSSQEVVEVADIIEAPIELCDVETLLQLRKEITKVIERIALGRELKNPLVKQDERQLDELKKYYKQYLDQRLQIRHFPTTSDKAYDLMRGAIQRTLSIAKKECPEAYHVIRKSLVSGMYFRWNATEKSRRKAPANNSTS